MGWLSAVVRWSLLNRPIVLFLTLVFAAVAARAAFRLSVDAVPDVTNVQVQVLTTAPSLSPVEVEQFVTVPVERAMAGLPKTTEVRSVSKYGISVVTVVFEDDTSIYFARQLVSERMREAQNAIATQEGRPELGPISTGLGEVFQFVVQNDNLSLMQQEELLTWFVSPPLRSVAGIVDVNVFGGEDRQYQVMLDPNRLQAAGVSVTQVIQALEKSNANAGGGYIEHNQEHFVVGTDGLVKNVEDLQKVVLGATPEGVPITLATVGDLQFGPRLRRGAASRDGRGEVVVGVALMLLGENSRTVTQAVKDKLAALQPSLPPGTRIEPFYDRSVLIDRTVHTVGKNLLEGALLVVFVLLLLLGDLRAGLVVAAVIPLSLLFALLVMHVLGLSGNLMSLGAIDFGLLVDGSVILVENAVRHLAERQQEHPGPLSDADRIGIVHESTVEVRAASLFGEIILAAVYLPILTLTGVEGKMFRPMAITVLLALLGALVFSLTLVPVLTSYVVRPHREHRETWLLRVLRRRYVSLLRHAFAYRRLTLLVGGIGVVTAAGALTQLGAEFMPQLDEGDLLVEARRLPEAALTESVATDLRIQKALLALPEVEHVVSRAGSPAIATDPMSMSDSDSYIRLKDRSRWRPHLTKESLAKEIAVSVENAVPEVVASISQPIQMRTNELVAGVRSDVAVLVYGPDLSELTHLGNQAAESIRHVLGAVDVRVEHVAGLKYLRVTPDRAKLARYGLTVQDVNRLTQTLAVGYPAGDVIEGDRRFGLVVKLRHAYDGDLTSLLSLPLRSVSGQIVPLGDVAALSFVDGPAQISRENQSRRLTVEFNVRERDLQTVVEEAQNRLTRDLRLPPGYRVDWGGQFRHYTEAKARLLLVVPFALTLILFFLWLAFRSVRIALLVVLNVPFGIVGGGLALWLRDLPFSISAGVGFIALFGVAVLNGLVLLSFAQHLQKRGHSPHEAILQAAELRLRPVLMTGLVASLGFWPMAVSTAPGAEVQRPLATVVIGGVLTSTLLTLFLLPLVYNLFFPVTPTSRKRENG